LNLHTDKTLATTATNAKSRRSGLLQGLGQLTLVEHSLCPLDPGTSLQENLVHEAEYQFTDPQGHRQTSRARVYSPLGLSAHDEFYLWGLIALTLACGDPTDDELHATPDYCLKQLALIDSGNRRGGRQYQQFAAAIERLSAVQYLNPSFYDPVRAEHRRVSFGFFSYTLPLDDRSNRAWRICWDRVFLEIVRASGGAMRFDLHTYKRLDPAGRRLFLFISKIFYRQRKPLRIDVRHLGVNVLGFSANLIPRDLSRKVRRCVHELIDADLLAANSISFEKTAVGRYAAELSPGCYFNRSRQVPAALGLADSPLTEALLSLGLSPPTVSRFQQQFSHRLLREWVDITLAARERFGQRFFKRSAAAYFVDNIRAAASGSRTPPDWWHDVRKAEQRAQAERHRRRGMPKVVEPDTESVQAFDHIRDDIFGQFLAAGQSPADASRNAERFARQYLRERSKPERSVQCGSFIKLF
jgi:hypothetical protein